MGGSRGIGAVSASTGSLILPLASSLNLAPNALTSQRSQLTRDTLRFRLGSEPRVLRDVVPTMTVLEYLRGG